MLESSFGKVSKTAVLPHTATGAALGDTADAHAILENGPEPLVFSWLSLSWSVPWFVFVLLLL